MSQSQNPPCAVPAPPGPPPPSRPLTSYLEHLTHQTPLTRLTFLTRQTRLTGPSGSARLPSGPRFRRLVLWFILAVPWAALADSTNLLALRTDLPSVGLSAIRTLAALGMVLAVFLGGVWLFRNSQRLAWRKSGPPRLAILESRPLGGRYALYVVGYEQQRLLIGSSPAGLSLLSQLPAATPPQYAPAPAPEPVPFGQYLQQLLRGRPNSKAEGTQ